MLRIKELKKSFGKLRALDGVDAEFAPSGIKAIIGPNGSGKTTLVNVVTGALKADSGVVSVDDVDVTHKSSHQRVRFGLARTYQIPRPFSSLTSLENVLVAAQHGGRLSGEEAVEYAEKCLKWVNLVWAKDIKAGSLTSEQQKFLDLARALASQPKYLFIDEIGAGLGSSELHDLSVLIKSINSNGISIVYIGHIMRLVKEISDTVMVMDAGKVIFQGKYEEAASNHEVIAAYLGDTYAKS